MLVSLIIPQMQSIINHMGRALRALTGCPNSQHASQTTDERKKENKHPSKGGWRGHTKGGPEYLEDRSWRSGGWSVWCHSRMLRSGGQLMMGWQSRRRQNGCPLAVQWSGKGSDGSLLAGWWLGGWPNGRPLDGSPLVRCLAGHPFTGCVLDKDADWGDLSQDGKWTTNLILNTGESDNGTAAVNHKSGAETWRLWHQVTKGSHLPTQHNQTFFHTCT